MSIPSSFFEEIVKRREALGLSQEEAAWQCKRSRRGYQKMERKHTVPRLDAALRLAYLLGISLDELAEKMHEAEAAEAAREEATV